MKKLFFLFYSFLSVVIYANQLPKVDMTNNIIKSVIGNEKYFIENSKIIIKVPDFADNPVQVPISIDASQIKNAKRLVIFADYNPISQILDMNVKNLLPVFSTNIKIANETPLRVLVQDENEIWHITSALIKSIGGGCSVSSLASVDDEFEQLFGITKGEILQKNTDQEIKASIFHPMETGLIFGNPEFYIHKIIIKNFGKIISDMTVTAAISENPRFIFKTKEIFKNISIEFIDNNGNNFELNL